MKKISFVLFLLFSQQLFSQYMSSGIGRWRLGLNVGATWQTADVSTDLFDLGYGATLEYALYAKQSSFFGFSLRGRFLQGKTTGYDYLKNSRIISNDAINGSIDSTFNYSSNPLFLNNKTSLNEFSLEAMLKWNRLYQNHGVLFYLYLGGGFTSYKVETDQLDLTGSLYDYSLITEGGKSSTVTQLKSIQDGVYETELSNPDYNTLVFTPAVGVGLGFRITPGLDFAIEHKISLPQTDLFDGQIYDSSTPSFIQDIYHYTSLGLIFSIVHHTDPQTYTPYVEPITEPIVTPPTTIVQGVKPTIMLTKPITNTFNNPNCKIEVIAKIENVSEQKDITFYHNGNKVSSYKYFFSPPTFKSTVELTSGNNNFKIIAKNGNLTTTKEFSLKCNNTNSIPICHKNNDGTLVQINIKESDWAQHAAHGDTKGNCPKNQMTICHQVSGQPGKTQTTTIPVSKWAIHKSHGDTKGACQEKKMITICHNNQELTINESDWAIHASHGDTKGACPQVKTITICHIPTTGNQRQTITIPENEWIVHQAHGDTKETCPSSETMITICHKNTDGTKTTLTIPEFRWNEHFAHGDSKSACPQSSFIICHTNPSTGKKENISIYASAWAQHAAHGDTKGACPVQEKQITICHNIPGQVGKTQTITIPESKWAIHKSHGDKLGSCVAPKMISICHHSGNRKVNITIKEPEWTQHAAHGDTKGSCTVVVDNNIPICHHSGNSKIQMIIKESQWNQHAAHGDTKGNCPKDNSQSDPIGTGSGNSGSNTKITICHYSSGSSTPQTIQIDASAWKAHQAHGDIQGACTVVVDNDIPICHHSGNSKIQMTIKESQWSQHAAHGDTKGNCPKDNSQSDPVGSGLGNNGGNTKITICHYSSGSSTPQTIQIDASAWKAHQAHGDTQGNCPKDNSQGSSSGGGNNHGNNSGNSKITICHFPAENSTPQTIQIDASAWRTHQAHGDTQGACNSGKNKAKGKNLR